MKPNNAKLTQGKPSKAIISMMVPMVIGLIVMIGNGLVDAYFIGKLGYIQLAAVSYAFPVWFIVSGVVMGLGVGTSSLVARAIGSDDKKTVKKIATHSMILAVVSGSLLTFAGLSSIDFIFGLLGANEETMPYVREYMEVYFWGALFLAVPMIGNSVLRASGDAKTPSLLMASSAIINAIFQQDSDSENKPKFQVVGKFISENTAYNLYAAFTFTGVSIGFYLSNVIQKSNFAILFILIASTLYFYASSMKNSILIGNIIVAFTTSIYLLLIGLFDLLPTTFEANQTVMGIHFSILFDYAVFTFIIAFLIELVCPNKSKLGFKFLTIFIILSSIFEKAFV